MKRLHFVAFSIKIWAGLLVVLMTVAVVLVITLSNVASRVDVIPQIFSKDPMSFGQLVEVTNLNAGVKEKDLIDEMLVRFYVENRVNYIPDLEELAYRYGGNGPIRRLSSPAVYRKFMAQVGNFAESVDQESETVAVDIIRVDRSGSTFTVDFDIYNYKDGIMTSGGRRRATIRIAHVGAYRRFSTDFVNPYGFVVIEYGESGLKKW